jgi:glycosyltransferase involved in cell wall biosynthesis
MQTLLFLTPSLNYGGTARQLTLLAAGLPHDRFAVRVCVLGGAAPWADALRAAKVEVDVLGWKRFLDPAPFLTVRRLLAEARPGIVHVWGRTALRVAAAVGGRALGRLFVSAALPPAGRPTWLDHRLVRRVGRVVAFGAADADRYLRLGVPADRVGVVAPGVPLPDAPAEEAKDGPSGRLLFGVGPLEPHKGFRDAVWALDILSYLYDDLHLVLAGAGSDRLRIAEFARGLSAERRVSFVGPCPDPAPWLHRSTVAWVPSRTGGGVCAALEAMAAGRAVVATRLPALAEVVVEGSTGRLVPPGDKTELARQTRFLLDDPDQRRACGEAGRRRVAEHFTVEQLVRRCAALYGE